jgi:MFS family permease
MDQSAAPSHARYIVVAFLGSLASVLYLDRLCIAAARAHICKDLDLSISQMGWVFSAFTIAYGLFEVPTGRWGDKFGSRGVLTRIVFWWSAFTALTGCIPAFNWGGDFEFPIGSRTVAVPALISSLGVLLVVRFLFGAGEAGALPNTARVVAHWFPFHERGWVQSIVLTSMQIGMVSSPVIASKLIDAVGWRWSFVLFGSVGVVWGGLFYWWFRDEPSRHPGVNDAERVLITTGISTGGAAESHPPIPWRLVGTSANVWLLGTIMSALSFASYMYMFWMQTYLTVGRGVDKDESAWLTTLALSGGPVGAFCSGFLSTWVVRLTGERRWSRRLLGCGLVACAGLFLMTTMFCDSPYAACACFALAGFCSQAQISNWWAAVMDISGKHLGALFGLMNSMGVPGAFVSPIFLGSFADSRKELGFTGREQWDPAFYVYAGVLFFGAVCWLFVDSTKSAVEENTPGSRGV